MKYRWKSHITYINIICILSVIISIGFTIGFLHGRDVTKWNGYILDTEIVGHYGDLRCLEIFESLHR